MSLARPFHALIIYINNYIYLKSSIQTSSIIQLGKNDCPYGSTLCILLINDLPDNVKCKAKLFADDAKIYSEIEKDNQEGCRI